MASRTVKLRKFAFQLQSGRCFYCRLPMWEGDSSCLPKANKLTTAQLAMLQCTAEHLQARCDGGANSTNNVVAAHKACNQRRHKCVNPPIPRDYIKKVQVRVNKKKWWPRPILDVLVSIT